VSYANEYVQVIDFGATTSEIAHCFHTFRKCPRCREDMVTDGKGQFFCDHCKHRDKQAVEHLRPALGYPGEGSYNWRGGFTFGKAEEQEQSAIEYSK